ncbi:MAG: 50S ribosomal protein L23 [Deltaproteobacteria bacterium]|jgi:large subunit ribosomal protein L23|nr:50S ribosomal protein L23 [Deltaproteobacteria bacterium]
MRPYYEILQKYIFTEKLSVLKEKLNVYCFRVPRDANKVEIGRAVEEAFELRNKVLHVNTVNVKGKTKRRGRHVYTTSSYKKAVVTLVKGAVIDAVEEA